MKRHTQNILAVFGSDAVVRLIGFVTTAFMARVLDPASFGTVSFGMAVLSYGVLFSSPGLHIIGAVKVADRTVAPSQLVRTITSLRAVLAMLFCAGSAAVFFFGAPGGLGAVAFFFSCVLLPISFQLEWYFQGKESLAVTGIGKMAASLIFASALILALSPVNFHWFVPLCYAVGMTAQAVILWLAYMRSRQAAHVRAHDVNQAIAHGEPAGQPFPAKGSPLAHQRSADKYSWRMLVQQALPVGAAVIAAQALLNFPSIALGIFSTTAEVARFSTAAKLIFFVLAIDRVMYSIFFPFVARTHANAPLTLPRHLERIAKYIFLACVPICIGGTILAPRILEAVYGPQYASAAPLLQIQLWYFFFTILNSLFAYPLIAIGQERYYGTATTIIAVSTIVLLLPLVYFFSSIGASAGLVVGEMALVASMAWKAGPLFPSRSFAHIAKPLIASLAMACFLVIFSYISLFILIPAAAIAYVIAAFAVKAFDKHDLLFLKERLV